MENSLLEKSESRKPKLLERVREEMRVRHYSYRTEVSYSEWIVRYVKYHQMKHPLDLGAEGVRSFLTHLATERNVTASTQNQALSALLFLYGVVLEVKLPKMPLEIP